MEENSKRTLYLASNRFPINSGQTHKETPCLVVDKVKYYRIEETLLNEFKLKNLHKRDMHGVESDESITLIYLEMDIKEPTKLSLTTYNNTFTWETDHSDVSMDDILEAFYGLCIGATFHPETVLEGMKNFAEERLPEELKEDVELIIIQ